MPISHRPAGCKAHGRSRRSGGHAAAGDAPAFLRLGIGDNQTEPLFLPNERDPSTGEIYNSFRIPSYAQLSSGRLVCFAEARMSMTNDASCKAIVYKYSDDGWRTRSGLNIYCRHPSYALGTAFYNLSWTQVHRASGRLFVCVTESLQNVGIGMTADNLATFTKMDGSAFSGAVPGSDFTAALRVVGANPAGHTFEVRGGTIASITVGNPTVITTTNPHGLETGVVSKVRLSGFTTPANLNGDWSATRTGASTFTVPVNTSGGTTGSPIWEGMWGWIAGPGSHGKELNSGRLLCPMHKRRSIDTAGFSTNHGVKCDNPAAATGGGGPVWSLAGGVAETVGGNQGANENCFEQLSTGRVLMHMRNVATGGAYRWESHSDDDGNTWSDIAQLLSLVGVETQGTVQRFPGTKTLVAMFPGDLSASVRARLRAAYSPDEGQTWVNRDLGMTFAGYHDALMLPGNRVSVCVETGHVSTDPGSGAAVRAFETISILTFSRKWLLAKTDADAYVDIPFNDDGPGRRSISSGHVIHDHGTHKNRIMGGNLLVPGPAFDSGGLTSVLTGVRILTASGSPAVGLSTFCPDPDESGTLSIVVNTTDNTLVLLATRTDAGAAGVGLSIEILANGKIRGRVADGTNLNTIDGNTAINDGADHIVSLVVDRANTLVRLFIDGASDATAVAFTATGSLRQTVQDGKIGEWAGSTSGRAATNLAIRRLYYHRKALTAAEQPNKAAAKPTFASLTGLTYPIGFNPPGSPLVFSGCKYWGFATGPFAYASMRGGPNGEYMRTPQVGDVAHSCVDLSDDRWLSRISWASDHGAFYQSETLGGISMRSWDHAYVAAVGSRHLFPLSRGNAGGPVNFDWLQTTPVFTISFAIRWSTVGVQQMILDNIDATANTGGFSLLIDSSNKMFLIIARAGGAKFSEIINHTALQANKWYGIAVQGKADGGKCSVWWKELTGAAVSLSGSDETNSAANIAAGSGSQQSTKDLAIFSSNAGAFFARDTRIKNLAIHDNLLAGGLGTAANLQTLFQFSQDY